MRRTPGRGGAPAAGPRPPGPEPGGSAPVGGVPIAVRVGTCGWGGSRARYVARFSLVELQETFYNLPRPETAARWRASVPPGFTFTLKAPQLITHDPSSPTYRRLRRPLAPAERARVGAFRDTEEVRAVWKATRALAATLEAPVVVFQCAASFTPTAEHVRRLERFFEWAPRDGRRFAWEPRGPAWDDARVGSLCRALDLIHCVDPFQRPPVWGEPGYFRLHGRGGYRSRYTDGDLEELLLLVRRYRAGFVLFNNISMLDDAARFQARLGG